MYDFVDRPVASLNRGGRMLVWAMRHWVRAVQVGRCPCGDIRPAFEGRTLGAAFPHFHVMMAVLNRHAVEKMRFGPVDCERVGEHEALVLAMVCAARGPDLSQAERTASLILERAQVTHLLVPMAALAHALADANRLPAGPIFDPDCARFSNE